MVYNVLGAVKSVLVNRQQAPGEYTVQFNAESLSSGIYFLRLKVGNKVLTQKMTLIR